MKGDAHGRKWKAPTGPKMSRAMKASGERAREKAPMEDRSHALRAGLSAMPLRIQPNMVHNRSITHSGTVWRHDVALHRSQGKEYDTQS